MADQPRAEKFKIFAFCTVVLIFTFSIFHFADAATNISATSTEHFAWNDNIGWIDFYSTGNVNASSSQLSGYASSSLGYIALDCATSPNGNICGTSNFKVSNDGSGNLSGWAYNDVIGWISFDSATASSSYFYQVTISPSTGVFSGWAWNDIIGWISFNCAEPNACGSSDYKVKTSWSAGQATANLISSIFDTGAANGVALNTIMWQSSSLTGGGTGAIDSVYKYAWNDSVGWISFNHSSSTVNVGTSQLTGYAYNSNILEIALDCATSPSGNICSSSNFKVSRNSTTGELSGYAWNDSIGWISFNCSDPGVCETSNYKVNVSPTTGAFTGYAWNDYIGWISVNCSDPGLCGSSDYRVNTAGNQSSGTSVKFQIASNLSLTGGGTGAIDSVYKYAWNDSVGWISFNHSSSTVNVGISQLTGYAYNSNILEIALDCATSPGGDICASSNFKVSRNSTTGELSGWAWNDNIGWISFSSENSPTQISCDPSDGFGAGEYCVTVNPTTGAFTGWAWNDYIGWISVNCSDPGLCGSSDYRVNTATTASWDFKGPDGSNTTYYAPIGPGYPAQINLQYHNNVRYFRYKIFLYSNAAQTAGPRVDDVIINYSP